MVNGISPTGVSFIILEYAISGIKAKTNITNRSLSCGFIMQRIGIH